MSNKRSRLAAVASGLGGAAAAAGSAASGSSGSEAANRIDVVRADAPELARHGEFRVGVRTLRAVNPGQLDAVSTLAGSVSKGNF